MSDSVITSAYCNLPPELHGSIFAYLRSPADRSALAASCRFLRQWRGLAWQRIEINAKRIDALLLQVRRLVRAMRCDDELPLFVQEVYVRGLGVYPKYSRLWHDFLDGNIAQILRLAINLHTFVFDAPIADGNETYEHILSAMASLPSLRSISLNNLGGSGDDAIVSLPSINSNVLERFIIGMGSAVDITSATKDQLQLKYLHFELCWESTWDPVCTLQMMSSWVSLEEIVLCTDHESFFAWDAWLDMLEKALDGGILRNLRTLSIEGPDSQQDLSNLLAILHKHNVPVSNFRFLVDDADFEILDGFGASSLEEVFDRLPSLETLCVDQFNHNNEDNSPGCEPLPGEWADYCAAFTRASRLKTFIAPLGSVHTPPWDDWSESSAEIRARMRVEGLMDACPTLHLVVCTQSEELPRHRFIRATIDEAAFVSLPPDVPPNNDEQDYRFWVPPVDIDVARYRHHTCCSLSTGPGRTVELTIEGLETQQARSRPPYAQMSL